jgi:hypothetical protein
MIRYILEQTWLLVAAAFAPFFWITILLAVFASGK